MSKSNVARKIESVGDFLRGQIDCKKGAPHQPGQSEDYNRDYSTQYQMEQIAVARSERK